LGLRVWGGGQLVDALVSVCAKVVALRLRQGVSHSIIKGLIRFHSIVKRFNHSIVQGSLMVFHLIIQGLTIMVLVSSLKASSLVSHLI